jgi:hypothetical protein
MLAVAEVDPAATRFATLADIVSQRLPLVRVGGEMGSLPCQPIAGSVVPLNELGVWKSICPSAPRKVVCALPTGELALNPVMFKVTRSSNPVEIPVSVAPW